MLKIEITVEMETRKCAAHVIDRLSHIDDTLCGPFFNYDHAYAQVVKGMLAEMEAVSPIEVTHYDVVTVYIDSEGNPTAELTQGPNEFKLVLGL